MRINMPANTMNAMPPSSPALTPPVHAPQTSAATHSVAHVAHHVARARLGSLWGAFMLSSASSTRRRISTC